MPDSVLWQEKIREVLLYEILTKTEQEEFYKQSVEVIGDYLSKSDCPLSQKAKIEERF
jgi:precorrin-4 methylase